MPKAYHHPTGREIPKATTFSLPLCLSPSHYRLLRIIPTRTNYGCSFPRPVAQRVCYGDRGEEEEEILKTEEKVQLK